MAKSPLGGPLEQAAAWAVRQYLDALKEGRPPATRRQRSAVSRRLAEIEREVVVAPPMQELKLVQERHELRELASWYAVEDAFVAVVRPYSRRHGISAETWQELGVAPGVLRRGRMRAPTRAG